MEKKDAIERLGHLRSEISDLLAKPQEGVEFQEWHRAVLDAVAAAFGPDSPEFQEFRTIRFRLDIAVDGRPRDRLQNAVRQKAALDLPDDLEIPQDHYFRERLYQAEEFLLGCILALRR